MRMTFRKPKAATGLLPSRSGATVVEFAIVVPILLAIIIFIVEISIQLLTSALLQFGVREASRFGITGLPYPSSLSASPPPTREAAITQIIALKGLGILNLAHLTVTLTSYSAFNTVGAPGQGSSDAGGSSAVVRYQVSYFQPWLFPGSTYLPAVASGLPGITHKFVTVVQNEAF